jgi:membrane associated rhomboid family serine protease
VWSLTLSERSEHAVLATYGLVPGEFVLALTARPDLAPYNILTIFTSMFLHGGILHVGGNMLYLWIFGNNIEDAVGHAKFLLFYLVCGVVAALVQVSFDPASSMPMSGASGAVSGVLGAYLLLFPRARVKTLIFIVVFITTVDIPAMLLLTIWFFVQILFSHGPGVAWFAHIGGFLFGLVVVKLFMKGRGPSRKAAW